MSMRRVFSFELIFWLVALVLLATADPSEHHFTLCPLANIGFEWCPGCGLGRSISWLLQGQLSKSLEEHWFGVIALIILTFRIIQLTKQRLLSLRTSQII